jgi:cell wall-associated NlpC family hydrolase
MKHPIPGRRHARHTQPSRLRRAGLATGFIGAAILTTAAAPPPAAAGPLDSTPLNEISQTIDVSQLRATEATAQAAVDYQLAASQTAAAASALKAAQARKATELRRAAAQAAAKARAARARRTAAAHAAAVPLTPVAATTTASPAAPAPAPAGGKVATLLAFVRAQLGKPYVLGGTGPGSYDCSGLVQAAYRTVGVSLPRVSQSQSAAGRQVSLSALQPGDILYWGGAGVAYHVAVYVGGGDFIGAQNPSSGVVEHPLTWDEPTGAVRVL